MIRSAFITTLRTNVGDDFVREGIRAVLDSLHPNTGYFINKHEPDHTCTSHLPEDEGPALRDKIEDADLIVQCGAPVYWNLGPEAGQACHSAEWVEPLWYRRIAPAAGKPVLNLAAGACQGYFGSAREIADDPECAGFIRRMSRLCRLITVRDRMAAEVNSLLGIEATLLPCASIHAWRRCRGSRSSRRTIALNYMPLAGHYELEGRIDREAWARTFAAIDERIRGNGFEPAPVAHNAAELEAMRAVLPGRRIFYSPDYQEYFEFYANCAGGVFNRVHGAMLLAGRGVAAVVVGNDSRSRMLDELSLPHWHVSQADPDVIVNRLLALVDDAGLGRELIRREAEAFGDLRRLCGAAIGGGILSDRS